MRQHYYGARLQLSSHQPVFRSAVRYYAVRYLNIAKADRPDQMNVGDHVPLAERVTLYQRLVDKRHQSRPSLKPISSERSSIREKLRSFRTEAERIGSGRSADRYSASNAEPAALICFSATAWKLSASIIVASRSSCSRVERVRVSGVAAAGAVVPPQSGMTFVGRYSDDNCALMAAPGPSSSQRLRYLTPGTPRLSPPAYLEN